MLSSADPARSFDAVVDALLREIDVYPMPPFQPREFAVLTTDSVDDVPVFDSMTKALRPEEAGQR